MMSFLYPLMVWIIHLQSLSSIVFTCLLFLPVPFFFPPWFQFKNVDMNWVATVTLVGGAVLLSLLFHCFPPFSQSSVLTWWRVYSLKWPGSCAYISLFNCLLVSLSCRSYIFICIWCVSFKMLIYISVHNFDWCRFKVVAHWWQRSSLMQCSCPLSSF